MKINKTTSATEMVIKNCNIAKENTENSIPLQYQRYAKIFSDEEAKHFPSAQPWDHKIKLRPGAPAVINRKVFLLTQEENAVQDEYIDSDLEKGYLALGDGPSSLLAFLPPSSPYVFLLPEPLWPPPSPPSLHSYGASCPPTPSSDLSPTPSGSSPRGSPQGRRALSLRGPQHFSSQLVP